MQIGVADAAAYDAHHDLVWSGARHGHVLDNERSVEFMNNCGSHFLRQHTRLAKHPACRFNRPAIIASARASKRDAADDAFRTQILRRAPERPCRATNEATRRTRRNTQNERCWHTFGSQLYPTVND